MTEIHQITRPLKSLGRKKKLDLVVSTVMGVDGNVQVISRYKENKWIFDVEVRVKNRTRSEKTIYWGIALPDGRLLTDPEHAELLESVKDFILSLKREPAEGRKRLKALTLIEKVKDLTPLLRWMVLQGMTQFKHLTGRTMDYVPYAKLSQPKLENEVGKSKHMNRLFILEDLYRQSDKLKDALGEHPWPDDSACTLSGINGRRGVKKNKTDPIQDRVVNELIPIALEYVQEKADFILDAREKTKGARKDVLEKYAPSKLKRNTIESYGSTDARSVADGLGFNGLFGLNKELIRLRTACYIVIDFFSGIRDSEMVELETGCYKNKIEKAGVELTWIHGNIIKYQHPDKPHAWIVPPVVITAIKVMEKLSKPLQEKMQVEGEEILKRFKQGNLSSKEKKDLSIRHNEIRENAQGIFLQEGSTNNNRICSLVNNSINKDLKNFCRHFKILGDDGKPFPLKTSHFRRTFAYYIARTEKYFDLNFLSRHFGHYCVSHTEGYTHEAPDGYKVDKELFQEIENDKREIQYEVMNKTLSTNTPLVGGKWILKLRPLVKTTKNKEEFIRKLSENINIVGTGTSWCVTDGRTVCCGGKCYVKRTMCKDCPTGFIGPEFLPMWKHIEEQQLEIIDCDDLGPDQKLEAREMLEQARTIISDLGGTQ